MLRLRIGDARFLKLLAEARRRYEFRSMSTRDFQALARESLPPRIPADALDAFFENWVYSTGVPALRLKTSKRGVAPAIKLTGTVEQSGVDNDFSVEVPVEIQFAKSAPQVVWVRTSNEPAPFSVTLKEIPLKVTIPAGVGVLARK
jgi:aminopeptidase N